MAALRESLGAKRARALVVYDRLRDTYPDIRCTLDYENPLQLLIMTTLAAQCTDDRVNLVCKDLFKRYRTPEDFAKVPVSELEQAIHPCGFYRNKAKNIRRQSELILERHGGEVPRTMAELTALPGVGRKTANVVLGECFGGQGVIVDTHCTRLTNRLGFTRNQDAVKIEHDLMKVWPADRWTLFSHFMVFHGRAVCVARAPRCSLCTLRDLCPFPDTREGKKIAK